ncbi:unnamed protein product [Effrenium voratum]|uniref:Uncharacterized protein n=1 Tax=Effrenium voratum TaxID=2562239 RepID=A0AA36IFB0_9DINO|nr:unnamed protein product [Effrenium voratum]
MRHCPESGQKRLGVRIYTYKLPVCSFEHFEAKEIDGTPNWGHQQFHAGRPPLLPIHRKLAYGRLATDDPHNATHFYIPAPFFFWDDSWQGTKEVCQETNARRLLHNRFLEREISIMAPASSKKGWLFSLWLRTQVHEPPDEFSLLLQIHNAHQKRSLRVGVQGGCLLMSLGNLQFSPGCQTSLANGEWHHVAGFMWSNLSAGLFLDFSHQGDFDFSDCCNDEKEDVVQALKEGWHIGGADAWSDVDLDCSIEKFFQSCASASPQESSNSPCLQRVRSFVESQPWLKRRRGWDHIVLFAGVDYPARFDPNHPLGDDDFVLEKAWPEFKSFVLLHHGARTERCLAHLTDPSYLKNDGTYEECARRVFQTVTIPPLFEDEEISIALRWPSLRRPNALIGLPFAGFNMMQWSKGARFAVLCRRHTFTSCKQRVTSDLSSPIGPTSWSGMAYAVKHLLLTGCVHGHRWGRV